MPSTRRSFLGAAAAATSSLALPAITSPFRRRAPRDPRDKARLMVIGVAGRGGANLNGVQDQDIRVLCDVDAHHLQKAAERFPDAHTCADFREILEDEAKCKELDGVVISTPDHTHYLPAMLALQHGLDVYCEKPLTQTVAQARRLLVAAQANGCVTQMGTQIHANENYRRVVEAVRAGAVGTVREVVVFVNGTNWSAQQLPESGEAPAHLDWDVWLGPAAERPYSKGYHPAGWRRYWAFGGGTTADMSCHFTDLAFWALDLDAPRSLVANGPEPDPECAPDALRCEYEFGPRRGRPGLTLHWHAAGDRPTDKLAARGLQEWRNGVLFVGDEGWLVSDYNRHLLGPEARAAEWVAPPRTIEPSPGHYQEWLACCARRSQPTCSFSYAVPLTEHVLLANVAYRAARGQRIRWHATTMRTDHDGANALLDVVARKGFDA
ncbi:MAG: Gfo/Idh/MocA family oxidoreductase [Planctomycetes bacterium]|nr:Gfo/Idh/MocA family oxidoreductase [Planctomycetota bacterium]